MALLYPYDVVAGKWGRCLVWKGWWSKCPFPCLSNFGDIASVRGRTTLKQHRMKLKQHRKIYWKTRKFSYVIFGETKCHRIRHLNFIAGVCARVRRPNFIEGVSPSVLSSLFFCGLRIFCSRSLRRIQKKQDSNSICMTHVWQTRQSRESSMLCNFMQMI